MTYEEAIYYAKGMKEADSSEPFGTFIDMAIEALEKQIPKKPYAGEYGGKCWCPSCNDEDEMDIYGTSYCPNCGQALDWRESKWNTK